MGPGEELSRLCNRLDHLLLNLMEDLENLQDKRESLNRLIEQGWFSLSQARYTMGTKSVSSLQYSPDMAPSTLVQDSNVESERTQFLIKHQEWEDDDPCEVEEIGAYDQVLRQRKGPVKNRDPQSPDKGIKKDQTPNPSRDPQSPDKGIKKDQTPTPSRDPQSADKGIKKNNTPTPSRDPLRWFGILVPQSLRQAQKSFQEGIMVAADVASLQSSIDMTRKQYRLLLAKKQELLAQSS